MKLMIFLIASTLLASQASKIPKCSMVRNVRVHHEKEVLLKNIDSAYQLAIDYNTNTLFFSYYNNSDGKIFSSAFLNLETNEHGTIPGINRGFASTVDNENNVVYLGGVDGLYKFDYETKSAKHIEGTEHSIWQMFFKGVLYYSTYPNEKVYIYKDGRTEVVPELADTRARLVALNNDLDFYFTNSSGLFNLIKSSRKTIELGDYNANAMTVDNSGNVYFSTPNAIYLINENDRIDEIVSLPDVYGVAIEKDGNIIYASENEILRLKPTKLRC